MALSMACIKVAPAFGKSNLATRKTSPAPRRGSVTVKALKQNAVLKKCDLRHNLMGAEAKAALQEAVFVSLAVKGKVGFELLV